jgi:phospholipid-binding lipoprotein MlaA
MTKCRVNSSSMRLQLLLDMPMRRMSFPLDIALAIFLILILFSYSAQAAVESDPLEGVNRVTHQFNHVLDRVLVKPLAASYQQLTPEPVKTGVKNFFSNLDDVRVTFNDLLPFRFVQAASDLTRFAVNSILGVGGLLNVADSMFDLKKNPQDFGKTLAHWGVGSGPDIVLPLFGPSTVRDSFGLGVDALIDPLPAVEHVESRNSLLAAKTVEFRASVLGFDDLISGDAYLFTRGAYLQYRDHVINGGFADLAFEDF